MRSWFPIVAGAAIFAAALAWSASELPADGVPLHVGWSGEPTRFGSRAEFLGTLGGVGAFMVALAVGVLLLVARGPLDTVNTPHKAYWTHPSRVDRFRRMLGQDVGWLFGVSLLVMALVPVTVVYAASERSSRLATPPLTIVAVVLVVGVIGYGIWARLVRYRPAGDGSPDATGG